MRCGGGNIGWIGGRPGVTDGSRSPAHSARMSSIAFDTPSTRQAAGLLEDRRGGSVLLLLGSEEALVAKSFRNLSRVNVLPAEAAGVADIVGAATLVASQEASA